jgi:acyl carrier protein
VWGTLLGVTDVGIHDNFFELGGHSLLLTQIVTRVRKQLKLDLPLRMLLGALTVADMATAIGAAGASSAPQAPAIKKLSRDAFRVKRSALDQDKKS